METVKTIRKFFKEYERQFNNALAGSSNADFMADAFADCFIEAHPAGVICAKNNSTFKTQIPKGNAFYRSIGTKSMTILAMKVKEIYPMHGMAKITWDSRYDKDGETIRIVFDLVYFVQLQNGKPKIFAYIAGDEQKLLRENKLIPESE